MSNNTAPAGQSLAALQQLRSRFQLVKLQKNVESQLTGTNFSIHAGHVCVSSVDRFENLVSKQVANFVFWPAKEFQVQENGHSCYEYEVEGLLLNPHKKLPPVRLTMKQLKDSSWINKNWGISPYVAASMYQHIYKVFHLLKNTCTHALFIKETGWHKIRQNWLYIHAGGAIGNKPADTIVRGDFADSIISRYSFPPNPSSASNAVSTMKSLLEIGSPNITYPLAAMLWMPPLAEIFYQQKNPISFATFLKGSSECGKSSIAGLALSAFGEMDKKSFPASFRDTAASMEKTFATLKDSLCVVDDYHPRSHAEQSAMNSLADSIGRMVADGNSRSRYNKDRLRPQAVVLATGETIPSIATSGLSRFLFIHCNAGDLDYNGKFKDAQKNTPLLRAAMHDYIAWIAANWDHVHSVIETAFTNHSVLFSNRSDGRSVIAVSQMACALEVGFDFLLACGQLDKQALQNHRSCLHKVLTDILAYNLSLQKQTKPADAFIDNLQRAINCTTDLLVPLTNNTFPPKAVGCYDSDNLYLLPTKTYDLVCRLSQRQHRMPLPPEKELWQALATQNIISWDSVRKRHTRQKRIPCLDNKNIDVLVIDRKSLPELEL